MENLPDKKDLYYEKSTILIVDDNPKNLQVLGQIVKELGSKIAFAGSGRKAVLYANENRTDLILLDIMMPEMDGYQVCRALKENPNTSDIPLIFVTAMDEAENEKKGFELGAVDYIVKPFNPDIVKARVTTHLRLKIKTDLLEKLAGIDGLTDIPNRRMLDERLYSEFSRAMRQGTPLTFVMIDIDNFKNYNDNYGHSAGDLCLRSVAAEIKNSVKRSSDFAGRFGGEEFAVILPGLDGEGVFMVLETLRSNIENLKLRHEYSNVAESVTISLGAVTLRPELGDGIGVLDIIDQADRALYQSKRNGKNMSTHKNI